MSVKIVALSAALLAAGCVSANYDGANSAASCPYQARSQAAASADSADESEEARDPNALALRGVGTLATVVRIDGENITGPGVSLGRYEEEGHHAVRGVIDGSVVDLLVDGDRVSGAIDNNPVDLTVVRNDSAINVHGQFPGRIARFRIDQNGLRGLIGGYSYDLTRTAEGGFAGRRGNGNGIGGFTMDLPDTMASWTDADVVAVLVLFMRKS